MRGQYFQYLCLILHSLQPRPNIIQILILILILILKSIYLQITSQIHI